MFRKSAVGTQAQEKYRSLKGRSNDTQVPRVRTAHNRVYGRDCLEQEQRRRCQAVLVRLDQDLLVPCDFSRVAAFAKLVSDETDCRATRKLPRAGFLFEGAAKAALRPNADPAAVRMLLAALRRCRTFRSFAGR